MTDSGLKTQLLNVNSQKPVPIHQKSPAQRKADKYWPRDVPQSGARRGWFTLYRRLLCCSNVDAF